MASREAHLILRTSASAMALRGASGGAARSLMPRQRGRRLLGCAVIIHTIPKARMGFATNRLQLAGGFDACQR